MNIPDSISNFQASQGPFTHWKGTITGGSGASCVKHTTKFSMSLKSVFAMGYPGPLLYNKYCEGSTNQTLRLGHIASHLKKLFLTLQSRLQRSPV